MTLCPPACTRTTACQALRSPPPPRLRAAVPTPLLLSPATSTVSLSRARRWPPSAPPTRRSRTRARTRAAHVALRRAERWLTCACTGSRCCGRTCPATLTWRRQYQARIITGDGDWCCFYSCCYCCRCYHGDGGGNGAPHASSSRLLLTPLPHASSSRLLLTPLPHASSSRLFRRRLDWEIWIHTLPP